MVWPTPAGEVKVSATAAVAAFAAAAVRVDEAAVKTTPFDAAAINAVELFAAVKDVVPTVAVAVLSALKEPACKAFKDVTADVAAVVVVSDAVLAVSWLTNAVFRVVVVDVKVD